MKLKSKDFNDYYLLPKTCGYATGNKAPSLYVEDVPEGATTLALVVYDSDILYGTKELTYWLVWNLPVDVGEFSSDNLPEGAMQGTNDMGVAGYSGPMLSRDIHHVHFLIFALNIEITFDSRANRSNFDDAVNGKFLDHATLTGMYQTS